MGSYRLERYGAALLEAIAAPRPSSARPPRVAEPALAARRRPAATARPGPSRPIASTVVAPPRKPAGPRRFRRGASGASEVRAVRGRDEAGQTLRLDRGVDVPAPRPGFGLDEVAAIRGLEPAMIVRHATWVVRQGKAVPIGALIDGETLDRWDRAHRRGEVAAATRPRSHPRTLGLVPGKPGRTVVTGAGAGLPGRRVAALHGDPRREPGGRAFAEDARARPLDLQRALSRRAIGRRRPLCLGLRRRDDHPPDGRRRIRPRRVGRRLLGRAPVAGPAEHQQEEPGRARLGPQHQFAELAQLRRFATAIVATYLATTDRLTISNAAHPRPIRYRAADRAWSILASDAPRSRDPRTCRSGSTRRPSTSSSRSSSGPMTS